MLPEPRRRVCVLVLGAPGSGKGTQCAKLAAEFGVPHISTGDLFRAEVQRGTDLGQQLAKAMADGGLVPDELGSLVLIARLAQADAARGWVGDGWTRERANSEMLLRRGVVDTACVVISLDVPRRVLVQRLSGRRVDPQTRAIFHTEHDMPADPAVRARLQQRPDDKAEFIDRRIDTFEAQRDAALAPLLQAGIPVKTVDGDGTPGAVFARVLACVGG